MGKGKGHCGEDLVAEAEALGEGVWVFESGVEWGLADVAHVAGADEEKDDGQDD